ncbi:TATA box-binding protein-associated factor RNA polymerase I subunit B isoform X2 [Austrofundulus limnaeus]|uniref:TATA box-binding protein-associated factor RNA polymerase I subunit B n=1 Tax=Austrofundulus limnaeus TaxID=52670 RepID=A0A2I4CPL2_AUSLI|nr:PREDICTED: TATA box-binding protein-associated factor RNA polymerase I subunit B isoform X2 [Austrofundulus limnaeus]
MDEEHTAGYREPCAQCAEVNWGISDEGRFYCRSCHNVIERTREAEVLTFQQGTSRVTTIKKGPRTKKEGTGYTWTVCEGFQFILTMQADALLRLGLSPRFKDEVLCQLWRLFLQKSQQAYCQNQATNFKFGPGMESDSDSAAESITWTTDGESNPPSTAGSDAEIFSDWTSSEGFTDPVAPRRRCRNPMSMRKTLALIHLALMWSHEELTLSDLLRLVKEGFVPYVNAFEHLPEEMKLFGSEALIFSTESIPSYSSVHKEAQDLVLFLDLPAPPPVSPQSLLHPTRLSLRYLMDANLPDDLHRWVCQLLERVGVADKTSRPVLPRYDLQTAAAIIVTMKLMVGLNDRTEWDLSNAVGHQDSSEDLFSFRRWFRLVQTALSRAQQNRDQDLSRKQWKPKNPIIVSRKDKSRSLKRKRVSEQLQATFERVSSCPAGVQDVAPSSFRFCWGDEDGSDGPSLHHMKLDQVLTQKGQVLTHLNGSYWHTLLQPCRLRRCSARRRFLELQPTLPRSFGWLLLLFSFLLDVEPWSLFKEVLKVESQLLDSPPDRTHSGRREGSTKRPKK